MNANTEIEVRVRYCETDRMGYCHHSNYPVYFEMARTEWLRKYGLSYKQMEDEGVIMPVADLQIKYYTPAKYDDVLLLKTSIKAPPMAKITFITEVFLKDNMQKVCMGEVSLAFQSKDNGKILRAPNLFQHIIKGCSTL